MYGGVKILAEQILRLTTQHANRRLIYEDRAAIVVDPAQPFSDRGQNRFALAVSFLRIIFGARHGRGICDPASPGPIFQPTQSDGDQPNDEHQNDGFSSIAAPLFQIALNGQPNINIERIAGNLNKRNRSCDAVRSPGIGITTGCSAFTYKHPKYFWNISASDLDRHLTIFGIARDDRKLAIPQPDDTARANIEIGKYPVEITHGQRRPHLAAKRSVGIAEASGEHEQPLVSILGQHWRRNHQSGLGIVSNPLEVIAVGNVPFERDPAWRGVLGDARSIGNTDADSRG